MSIEQQSDAIKFIDFNDRLTLLELIEFTRNSAIVYGSVNILEHFIEQKLNGKS